MLYKSGDPVGELRLKSVPEKTIKVFFSLSKKKKKFNAQKRFLADQDSGVSKRPKPRKAARQNASMCARFYFRNIEFAEFVFGRAARTTRSPASFNIAMLKYNFFFFFLDIFFKLFPPFERRPCRCQVRPVLSRSPSPLATLSKHRDLHFGAPFGPRNRLRLARSLEQPEASIYIHMCVYIYVYIIVERDERARRWALESEIADCR